MSAVTRRTRYPQALIWLMVLTAICVLSACGSGSGEEKPAPVPKSAPDRTPPIAPGPPQMGVFIDSVTVSPEVISVETPVEVNVALKKDLEKSQILKYKFMRNGEPLQEGEEPTLPAGALEKGDILWVEAAVTENEQDLDYVKTAQFFVGNASPRIDDITLPNVKGPGTYRFAVKATDPDHDALTYSVDEKNFPFPYEWDQSQGVMTCEMGADIPDFIEFTVTIEDGFGGKAEKIVSMSFFKRPVKTQ